MIRRLRRRLRLRWLVLGWIVVALIVGWDSAAEARTRSPEHPRAPSTAAAPTDHPCRYVRVERNGAWTAELRCDGIPPSSVPETHKPPLPASCTRTSNGGAGADETITCSAPGKRMIHCKDDGWWFFDDEKDVEVPDMPEFEWWYKEIERESGIENGKGCTLAEHPPQLTCDDRATESGGENLVPDGCWGTYPSDLYELSWEDGAWYDVSQYNNRMMGWITQLMFGITKGSVQIALWLVGWGFTFDLAQFTQYSTEIARRYDVQLVDQFGLQAVAWFVLFMFMGFTALRGRLAVAGGELLLSIVLAGLTTVLFTYRADYMNSLSDRLDEVSVDVLMATQDVEPPRQDGTDPRDPDQEIEPERATSIEGAVRPLQRRIFQEFVETPYIWLNYGPLPNEECRVIWNNILSTDYTGDGWPSRYMRNTKGCEEAASFNEEISDKRMLGALLTMIVGIFVAVFLGLSAVTIVISKFLLALLFAVTPFISIGAVLPGSGRRMAWAWLGSLLQLAVTVMGMSFLVTLLMISIDEVLQLTQNQDLATRWAFVLLVVSTVYFTRKRLLGGAQTMASKFADNLTRLSPASANYSGGGSVGFDLDRTDRIAYRSMKGAGIAAGATVAGAWRTWRMRAAERRIAGRGYRNLERMERTRERPIEEFRFDSYGYGGGLGRGGGSSTGRSRGGFRPQSPGGRPKRASVRGHWSRGQGHLMVDGIPTEKALNSGALPHGSTGGGGGFSSGGGGSAGTPGRTNGEWRARYEVRMQRRAPRSFARQPVGHFLDKIRHRTPLVGTRAQMNRKVRGASKRLGGGWYPSDRGWN